MGSIFGAAAGALLYAFVANFAATYLPSNGPDCCTQYSTIVTFVLIALVLSVPAAGALRQAGMSPAGWTHQQRVERTIAAIALVVLIVWPAAAISAPTGRTRS